MSAETHVCRLRNALSIALVDIGLESYDQE
jgi:hypothetical protein